MPRLIKDGAIVEDDFTLVEADETSLNLPAGKVLVRLAVWQQYREQLLAHAGRKGVLLAPDQEAITIAADLHLLDLVAIDFPAFADGRGYSTAYLLRTRHGFRGELRAVGDILKDTLFYQQRCGFNSFAVRADRNIETALKGLKDFSEFYQASATQAQPLYRRRLA